MTYIPEQLEALNRAIAEYVGYDYDKEFFEWQHLSGVGGAAFHLNYTDDMNAIVEVVQKWLDNDEDANMDKLYLKTAWPFGYDQPALALSIAFAKAAGLKGEWDE
jgi:hypothetical protein